LEILAGYGLCDNARSSIEQEDGQRVPVLCAANGKRDAGVSVKGTLTSWESVTSHASDEMQIAVIPFKDEVSAVEHIKASIESGAKAALLVRQDAPLHKLNAKDLDALSVPVTMVNKPVSTGVIATLEVDSKGTWTFPSLPAPYKFFLRGVELVGQYL